MENICAIKEIYRTLYQFEKDFQEANGISINDAMVLCFLKNGEEKSAGEICEFIGLSNSRVSKVLCSVENEGYIVRRLGSSDKRQMFFSLTEKGKKKIKEIMSKPMQFSDMMKKISSQCTS